MPTRQISRLIRSLLLAYQLKRENGQNPLQRLLLCSVSSVTPW